jgi:hypothetical protein
MYQAALLVLEEVTIVPVKTPFASIEPEPLLLVVGTTALCGFIRILQSAQLAVNPLPVTVIVAPRAAVEGVNVTDLVTAVIVVLAT